MTHTHHRHPVLRFSLYALVVIAAVWAVLVAVSIIVHAIMPIVVFVTALLLVGWGVRMMIRRRWHR